MSLTKAQVATGVKVHVICAGYPKLKKYEFVDGIHIHRVPRIRANLLNIDVVSYGISSTLEMWCLDKAFQFDIIHGHGYDPAVSFLCRAFMRKDLGFLISVHMTQIGSYSKITPVDPAILDLAESFPGLSSILQLDEKMPPTIKLMLERASYRNADKLLANSKSTAKELERWYGIRPERISVVYAGVDIDRFHPNINAQDIISRLNLRKSRMILCVAAFSLRKGVQYLISAIPTVLEDVPNSKFIFVGKGFLRPLLQEKVNRLEIGDSVRFLGTIPHEQMPSLYTAADLVVLPSVYEPFGKVLVEAMACGKPIVATRVSGIPEVVSKNETGILVPPKRPDLLAKAIIEILLDANLAKRMALRGRERAVRLFTWKEVAERVLKAYKETMIEKK